MSELIKNYSITDVPKSKSEGLDSWDLTLSQIYGHSNLDSFPGVAIDNMLSLLSACAGSFFLWDEAQKVFVLQAVRGPYRDKMEHKHIKLREGILGWVGGQATSILVKDIHSDQRVQSLKRFSHYKSYSFISIPLVFNHQLLGVINVTEREDLTAFSEEDLQTAQAFAKHIATAFDHLKAVTRLEKENKDLYQTIVTIKQEQKEQEPFLVMGKLASKLAHELNNPLDAIRRYVNLALDQSLEDSLSKEYLTKAKRSIRRAIRVIRHLLQFMSASKCSVRTVEIHELLDQSFEVLDDARFEKIKIQKDYCSAPSYISDRGLLLVFHNLYLNACQAMRGAGTITISTHRDEHQLTVLIEDTGCGISQDIQPRLFEPLFSTKNPGDGTGIGLSLCREIVQRCGGNIACDPAAQQGARFVITLPCLKKGE